MATEPIIWLNGAFVTEEEATVSVFDRGFMFAHSAYEVTPVYKGRLIDFDAHMIRLQRTLAGLEIRLDMTPADWLGHHQELIARNDLTEGMIYLQVSAGVAASRDFVASADLTPTLLLVAQHKRLLDTPAFERGISAVFVEDLRWKRSDLKTTQLVSAALAKADAIRRGADDAIWHVDGIVTEAASSNVWIVTKDGELLTRNVSNSILAGITRQTLLDSPAPKTIQVSERTFTLDDVRAAQEIFITSATAGVTPVVRIEGQPVGSGKPGPITQQMQAVRRAALEGSD